MREIRLIHELEPRFNRQATTWRSLRVPAAHRRALPPPVGGARGPRRRQPATSARCRSARFATRVAEAVETAVPLRRCTARPAEHPGRRAVHVGTAGRRHLPVRRRDHPGGLRGAHRLGPARPVARPRGAARPPRRPAPRPRRRRALRGGRRHPRPCRRRSARRCSGTGGSSMWRRPGRVVLSLPDGSGVELQHGRLLDAWDAPRLHRPRRSSSSPTRPPRQVARRRGRRAAVRRAVARPARPPTSGCSTPTGCWRHRSPAWRGSSRAPADGPDGPVAWSRWVGSSRCS